MRSFSDEQGRTSPPASPVRLTPLGWRAGLSARDGGQGFSSRRTDRTPQTASSKAAGANPRRTPLIVKRAIYGWKPAQHQIPRKCHPSNIRAVIHANTTQTGPLGKSVLTFGKYCDLIAKIYEKTLYLRICDAFIAAWAFASSWTSSGRSLPAVINAQSS